LVLIIFLYGSFMAYFCMANPDEQNNIEIEKEKITEKNASTSKTIGPEVYLCEITDFYEHIITILFGVIGILLALSFAYVYFTSKKQAEEMARDALEEKSFKIILQSMIAKGADEFIDRYSGIPELEQRIAFLEEQANIKGYELSDEDSSEE